MTDEKFKKYTTNYYVEGYNNLYDILEYWKQNPARVEYDIWYKNVDYTIRVEDFPVPEHGKPYIAYYLNDDCSDEHITYFDTLEEMLENYHLQDGTLLLDYMTDPKYADAE